MRHAFSSALVTVAILLTMAAPGQVSDSLPRAIDQAAEVTAAINRLTAAPIDDLVVRDMTVLRLRALVAQADGDETAYLDFRDRYRAMATESGFEGQVALAGAMP